MKLCKRCQKNQAVSLGEMLMKREVLQKMVDYYNETDKTFTELTKEMKFQYAEDII